MPDPRSDRFLRACQLLDVDTTPIWLMRQAGRSLPAYRALRQKHSFQQVADDPDLCAQVTLLPVDELGVDAAIIFADIMTPLGRTGVDYEIVEGRGPVIAMPISRAADIERIMVREDEEIAPQLNEAIRLVKKQLDGKVPLIGFAGAPFTLASYLIEGSSSREFSKTKWFMYSDPGAWHRLMERLSTLAIGYMRAQVNAGAQALQLFDSWIGALGPQDYRSFVLPHSRRIFQETLSLGVPRIHFGTGTSSLLELMTSAGSEVVGVDFRISIDEAWKRIGPDRAVQGNLDPGVLLGPPEFVAQRARDILRSVGGRRGHIFNLGHGVLPDTSVESLKTLVETVHSHRSENP